PFHSAHCTPGDVDPEGTVNFDHVCPSVVFHRVRSPPSRNTASMVVAVLPVENWRTMCGSASGVHEAPESGLVQIPPFAVAAVMGVRPSRSTTTSSGRPRVTRENEEPPLALRNSFPLPPASTRLPSAENAMT